MSPARQLFLIALALTCHLAALESRADEAQKPKSPAAGSMVGKEAGQMREDNGLKMKLVWCPPGAMTHRRCMAD